MKKEWKKSLAKRRVFWLILASGVLILFLIAAGGFYYHQKKHRQTTATNSPTPTENRSASSQNSGTNNDHSNIDQKDNSTPQPQPQVKTNTTDPYSLYNASTIAYNSGDYNTALNDIDQALAIKTDEELFYSEKAEILVKLNRKDDAIAAVKTGLAMLPNNALLENKLEILQNVP